MDSPVYENFDVEWTLSPDSDIVESEEEKDVHGKSDGGKTSGEVVGKTIDEAGGKTSSDASGKTSDGAAGKTCDNAAGETGDASKNDGSAVKVSEDKKASVADTDEIDNSKTSGENIDEKDSEQKLPITIHFTVNDEEKTLSDQSDYIFTDIFRVYDFNTNERKGSAVITEINGEKCGFTTPLKNGDKVKIYWAD